ncbi:MAG: hypothetical protein Q9195_007731 [Heterodermia aff. obscurata]
MSGASRLLTLPPEIISNLLNVCNQPSLENLSLTCRTLHETIALSLKYRTIDVSVHRIGRFEYTHWNGTVTHYWSDQYPPRFDVENLARKQHKFLSEVLDRPYLGRLIHDFTWTIRSYCDPDGYWPGRMTKDAVYPDTQMWAAFQSMTNVTKLDLACYQETWDWVYLRQPPGVLFPSVTDLHLSGIMYRQIVETIFNSVDLSNLEHLSLDNLQDPGRSGDEYPYKRSRNGAANWDSTEPPQDTDETKLPGTMRGILPLIQDRCSSLRSFSYRKPGWWVQRRGMSPSQDEECYMEVASFIGSVASTLEAFTFEQGVPESLGGHLISGVRGGAYALQKVKPMDERFVKHVLPVLFNTAWPALKELNVVGVGKWKGKAAIDAPTKARLRKHLGQELEIHYGDLPKRPCVGFTGS